MILSCFCVLFGVAFCWCCFYHNSFDQEFFFLAKLYIVEGLNVPCGKNSENVSAQRREEVSE